MSKEQAASFKSDPDLLRQFLIQNANKSITALRYVSKVIALFFVKIVDNGCFCCHRTRFDTKPLYRSLRCLIQFLPE